MVAAGNPVLVECFDTIWGRGMAVLSFAETARSGGDDDQVDEHRQLFAAIMGGDPDLAEAETIARIRREVPRV